MTRVFTNGTFLWQTTREYQPSPIPTFQLWLSVRHHLPSIRIKTLGVWMVIPFEHHGGKHKIKCTTGKHVWRVSGDFACSTQDQTISLSLRLVYVDSASVKLEWVKSFLAPAALRSSPALMASASISSRGFYLVFWISSLILDIMMRFLSCILDQLT